MSLQIFVERSYNLVRRSGLLLIKQGTDFCFILKNCYTINVQVASLRICPGLRDFAIRSIVLYSKLYAFEL